MKSSVNSVETLSWNASFTDNSAVCFVPETFNCVSGAPDEHPFASNRSTQVERLRRITVTYDNSFPPKKVLTLWNYRWAFSSKSLERQDDWQVSCSLCKRAVWWTEEVGCDAGWQNDRKSKWIKIRQMISVCQSIQMLICDFYSSKKFVLN